MSEYVIQKKTKCRHYTDKYGGSCSAHGECDCDDGYVYEEVSFDEAFLDAFRRVKAPYGPFTPFMDHELEESEIGDLKALAASHTRLLQYAKSMAGPAPEFVSVEAAMDARVKDENELLAAIEEADKLYEP